MIRIAALLASQIPLERPAASDWVTTGTDCTVFACADVDGDGRDDVLTINGAKQLCVAYSVRGEKASAWSVLRENVPDGVVAFGLTVSAGSRTLHLADESAFGQLVLGNPLPGEVFVADPTEVTGILHVPLANPTLPSAPANGAQNASPRWSSMSRDSSRMLSWILEPRGTPADVAPPPYETADSSARKPFLVVDGDVNGDGRMDTLAVFAATLPYAHHVVRVTLAPATSSGDLDSDGVSDADEAKLGIDPLDRDTDDDGLLDGWEVHDLPCAFRNLDRPLDPRHQDVIVWVSRYAQLDAAAVHAELQRSKRLYEDLANENPDGTTGIRLHYVWGPDVPIQKQGNWWDVGERELPQDARGIMHWMQVTPGGGGQSSETASMGGSGLNWAAFAHELGHQLSLSHTGDSEPAWCPFYPSIMNYAFNYWFDGDGEKIRFSDGKRRRVGLDERALHERVELPFADVSYLAKGPFYFTIEKRDDGRATWIDWNHDGRENDGTVSADVNYGGSTYGGTRRDVGFVKAGPAMALVGGKIVLASVERESGLVALRTYLGDEKWSEPRVVPDSATDVEPVLAGYGGPGGILFVRSSGTWRAAVLGDGPVGVLAPVGDEVDDLAACAFEDGVILVARMPDGTLASSFLGSEAVTRTLWRPLQFASTVPVGLAFDPKTKEVAVAGSAPNADGKEKCLHVAWFTVGADHALVKREERIVGGPKGVVHCTSRPVVRFTKDGGLVLFHTGWPGDDGSFTAYRSTQVANRALNDGWLVCLMYDIWTRTKVPVTFETDGTNAVYSYRWDASADRMNMLQVAHDGLGIDKAPMRDFDDAAKISRWGIRHSILNLHRP